MSELHENKNLESNKFDELPSANESGESGEKYISRVNPHRDILSYLNTNGSHLNDKNLHEIERTYDFVNFVYGKSNTERLSKIIDKVLKKDMEFFKDKTDMGITDWQKQKNPNYRFEDSLYAKMKKEGHSKLVELMFWHMILLDILNLKYYDLAPDKSLEESIEDAVNQKSSDRLDFLYGDHQLSYYSRSAFGETIYEYAKQIFKDLPEKQGVNQPQEQLMSKIFACFTKVAFCKMEESKELECYRNDQQSYENYRDAIFGFKSCFFLGDDIYNSCVKAVTEDMAAYLFLTGELEIMFNSYGDDFFRFFGRRVGREYGEQNELLFKEYLFFLNKIEPLENRYNKNGSGFIEKYFPGSFFDCRDAATQAGCILPYFKSKKLPSLIMERLKQRFDEEEIDVVSEQLSNIEELQPCMELEWEQTNYFRDIIKRFAGGEKYSNELVEGMSMMLCQEKDNIINIQQSGQENNVNKLIESPSVNEKEEDPKKTVEYTDLNKYGKSSLNNCIKIENNYKITTKAKNKIENGKKNWFFRFVRVVLDFFRRIGSRISNFFWGQPKKIDSVGIKNNSVFQNINGIGSQNSKTLEMTDLNDKEQKNI